MRERKWVAVKTEITLRPAGLTRALTAVEAAPEAEWTLVFSSGTRNGELITDPLPVLGDSILDLLLHLRAYEPEDRQIQVWSDHHPLFLERRGTELTARTSWPGPDSAQALHPQAPEALGWVRLAGAKWDDEIVLVTSLALGDLPNLAGRLADSLVRMLGITGIENIHLFSMVKA